MEEIIITVLGLGASVLSVLSLMPQVLRTWRTRSAEDLSAGWLVMALVAMVLWIVYGGVVGAPAVVWANVLTTLQASVILAIKLGLWRRPPAAADGM